MNFALPGQRRNTTMTYLYRDLMLVVLVFLLGTSCYFALTLGVALDGSQPYSSIQSAVQASAPGDTVLVYPGRYIENVDYFGKNITIASLELVTGNPAYRDSTIIDGNRNGSVVKISQNVSNARIYGFTIMNGSGTPMTYYQGVPVALGGGILVYNASAFGIRNCIVEDNLAYWGGGIYVYNGTIQISGTIVRDNFATSGGGIQMDYHGQAVFDQSNRCSIYNNTSGNGQDILAANTRLETNVYLDMGTICPTHDYYVCYIKSVPDWTGGFNVIDIQRGFRSEINHDLYVSPGGDDNNDGLSLEAPIKSISKAMQLVESDSLNQKIVHLASGVYSTNDNQFFPVSIKPHVKLYGSVDPLPILENLNSRETLNAQRADNASIENLIIDYGNNNLGGVAIGSSMSDNFKLKNIRILPHQSVMWKGIVIGANTYSSHSCKLEDVYISGQTSNSHSGFNSNMPDAIIKNLTIEGCHNTGDEYDGPMATFYFHGNKLTLENSKIINNTMDYDDTPVVSIGAAHFNSDSRLIMNNVLVANNQTGGESPVYIAAFTDSTSLISNCTFANNRGSYFAATLKGNLQVSNCIFDNDTPAEILIENTQPNFTSTISFNNNFIRGYPQSFSSVAANQICFNDVVLTGDPGFCDLEADDPLSYRLGNSSILRDAGTPETTGLFLPDTDLFGNHRIFNNTIDIGCSEWNGPVAVTDEYQAPPSKLIVYPNPFSSEAKISFSLDQAARVQLKIFNLRGQLVCIIADGVLSKGDNHIIWDGRNLSSRSLAAGVYLLQMKLDSKSKAVVRVLKL